MRSSTSRSRRAPASVVICPPRKSATTALELSLEKARGSRLQSVIAVALLLEGEGLCLTHTLQEVRPSRHIASRISCEISGLTKSLCSRRFLGGFRRSGVDLWVHLYTDRHIVSFPIDLR